MQTQLALAFPAIDPVIVQIGPVALRWYGLAYVLGITAGWWLARRRVADPRLWGGRPPITPLDIDDLIVWSVIGIVAGGRLGYVLFYGWSQYAADPAALLAVWQGGMSFHGGLLGVVLAIVLFARRRGIPVLSLLDVAGAVVPVGLFFGRVANFINQELWGRPTDLPWGVVFPLAGPEPRHPTQLYEAALEGLVLFAVLRVLTHRRLMLRRPGFVGGAFLAGYAVARLLVESVRLPDAHIGYLAGGWLTMGMVLTLPLLLVGLAAMALARPKALPPVP